MTVAVLMLLVGLVSLLWVKRSRNGWLADRPLTPRRPPFWQSDASDVGD